VAKREKKAKKQRKPAWIVRRVNKWGYHPGRVMREVLEWAEVLVVAGALAALIMSFVTVRMHVPTDSMWPTINGDRSLLRADSFFVDRITYYFRDPKPGDIVVFRQPRAVLVSSVERGSPADLAGMAAGEYVAYEQFRGGLGASDLYTEANIHEAFASLAVGENIVLVTAEGNTYRLGSKSVDMESIEDLGVKFRQKLTRYVKRLIAVGGQTVQIRDGDLYVDDVRLEGDRFDHDYVSTAQGLQYGVEPTLVPEDHYFMLGDNSANSLDSRYWGFVHDRNIIGVPYLRVWPLSRFSVL